MRFFVFFTFFVIVSVTATNALGPNNKLCSRSLEEGNRMMRASSIWINELAFASNISKPKENMVTRIKRKNTYMAKSFGNAAKPCCKNFGITIFPEEAKTTLDHLDTFVDSYKIFLSSAKSKKTFFDKYPQTKLAAKNLISTASTDAIDLLKCMSSDATDEYKPALLTLETKVKDAAADIKSVYNI